MMGRKLPAALQKPARRRRMRRGVVEKEDLDLVFAKFEALDGGLMGLEDFGARAAPRSSGRRRGARARRRRGQ